MMLELYTYNAGKGDCIRIRYEDTHNIFIDSGVIRFGLKFRSICDDILSAGESLDLLILTHVDDDHIGGILSQLRLGWECPFNAVRMNKSGAVSQGNLPLSTKQNDEVYSRLTEQDVTISPMLTGNVLELDGAILTSISPVTIVADNMKSNTLLAYHNDYGFSLNYLSDMPIKASDRSINNKNSIVFIFEYEDKRLLFTGDAWPEDIIAGIRTSLGIGIHHFDLMKLPHHGAVGNISDDFSNHIDCSDILICTDGVMHPDKQTIAKLIKWYSKIKINIYSPSNWWGNGFFTGEDDRNCVNLIHKEGLVIKW